MAWRYHVRRARTGIWLDRDAQIIDPTLSWALSGVGEFNCRLDARVARTYGIDGRFVFDDWSSFVYAEENGVLRWAGIVDASEDAGNGERTVHARSLAGYAKGVKYTSDVTRYYEIDAFDLIRLLWTSMQSDPMCDIDMAFSQNQAGVVIGSPDPGPAPIRGDGESEEDWQARLSEYATRTNDPYELAWYNTPDFGEEMDKIVSQVNADYVEEHSWLPETDGVEHKIGLYWPTAGARRHDLRFVEAENVAVPPSPASEPDEYANHVIALGAGEERHMLREEAQVDDGRLKRHMIAPAKDLYSPLTLQALARSTLAVAQNTIQYDSIEITEHPNAPIGSWNLGDEILLETFSGYYELNEWVKIVGWSLSPSQPDRATLSVMRLTSV